MKLIKGMKLTIGGKTWVNEIPEDKLAIITRDWPSDRLADFKKLHEEKQPVKTKKVDGD